MRRAEPRGLALALVLAVPAACYAPGAPPPLTAAALSADGAAPAARPAPDRAAAPAEPAGGRFDAAAAVAYALRHSPLLQERDDQEAIARAGIAAARQLSNPELRIGRSFEDDVAATSRFVVALRVHPDLPWALDAKVAEARALYRAEQAATAAAARAVTARIRQLYAKLELAEATRGVLDRQLAVLAERGRLIAERLERAAGTRLEALLSEEDVAELRDARATLELAMLRDRAELARVIGLPPGRPFAPVLDPAALAAPAAIRTSFDRRALADRALAADPALAELAARADAAGASAYQERARRIPWLDSLQVERSVRDAAAWGVTAMVTLPIFSANTGRIAAADAQRHRHLGARERLAAQTVRRIAEAADVAEATGRRARELAERLEPAGKQLAELLAQERAAAAADPVKLLLLEERHVRARRAALEAAYEHRVALIELEALSGGPP